MTSDLAIRVTGLRKSYGHHVVLDGVDLAVERGSVYSLLGPNGAGNPVTELRRSSVRPEAARMCPEQAR